MAKLILSMDGLVLKEIPLTKQRLTIGRKSHNDIQIDNMAVSGEHAAVVTILNDSFLEDLNSTNGTLVNGQPVRKHFLKNGDVIEFSKYKLKYFAEPVSENQLAAFEPEALPESGKANVQLRPSAPTSLAPSSPTSLSPAEPLSSAPKTFKPVAPQVHFRKDGRAAFTTTTVMARETIDPTLPAAGMRLLSGPSTGRQLELTRLLTSLGKPGVQAAVIARKPRGYFIMQAEGSPPPLINDQTMTDAERLLNDRDVIELAGVKMEFFLQT